MRTSHWLVAGALVAAVAVIAFWPPSTYPQMPSPPGQYPLDARRPEWEATQSVGLYRPLTPTGQDTLAPSMYRDAKMRSGGNRKICTLPTVPLGPQLQLELAR